MWSTNEHLSELAQKVVHKYYGHTKDVFKTMRNIQYGVFLWKEFTTKSSFSQEASSDMFHRVLDIRL